MNDTKGVLRTWLKLLIVTSAMKKAADTQLKGKFGASIARFDIMSALNRAGPKGVRAGALSAQLMVSDGNITQVAAPLIRDGLVRRRTDLEDGRVAIFSLTRKGERCFDIMAQDHRAWISKAFSNFSETDLAALRKLLDKIESPETALSQGRNAA